MCVFMFCVKFLNNIIRLVFDLRLTAGDQTTKHHVSCQIRNAGLGKPGHLLIRQTYTRTLRMSRVRCCADVQICLPHAGLQAAALACAGRPAQPPRPTWPATRQSPVRRLKAGAQSQAVCVQILALPHCASRLPSLSLRFLTCTMETMRFLPRRVARKRLHEMMCMENLGRAWHTVHAQSTRANNMSETFCNSFCNCRNSIILHIGLSTPREPRQVTLILQLRNWQVQRG